MISIYHILLYYEQYEHRNIHLVISPTPYQPFFAANFSTPSPLPFSSHLTLPNHKRINNVISNPYVFNDLKNN